MAWKGGSAERAEMVVTARQYSTTHRSRSWLS